MITVDTHVCNGCGDCVKACYQQLGERPTNARERLSRILVLGQSPLFGLTICRQCAEAPCADACISGALEKNRISNRVELNERVCVGCGMCVMVCPFGAIRLDELEGKAVKCDLCPTREIPACVSACRPGALGSRSSSDLASGRRRAATQQRLKGDRRIVALSHRPAEDLSQ
jgi:carbon-monoxide dehydrogenase iron sulfur subunit